MFSLVKETRINENWTIVKKKLHLTTATEVIGFPSIVFAIIRQEIK